MTEQSKKAYLYPQDDVSYVPVSTTAGQACGGCRWFNDGVATFIDTPNAVPHCHLVQGYPLPIRETGWCNEYAAIPEPEPSYIEVLEELTEALASKEHKPNLLERIKALFLFQSKARDEPLIDGFKALGNGKWVGVWSNNFEDREGEYFTNRATDAYIARLDAKEIPMPELWFWHTKYSFGQAKSVVRIAADDSPNAPSLSIAVGEFYDTPIAKAFEQATLKSKKAYKMSHGYLFPPTARVDGVYHYYDTFEISVLPAYAAANPYTLFGDETMPTVSPEKHKELEALLGKEYAAEVVTKAEQRAKELADKGVGYKEMPIPAVDTQAREQLDTLQKSITELSENLKAAMKPPVDDEDEAAKKKKADEAKKETDNAILALNKQVSELSAQVKSFLELTPRRASKASETVVPSEDPALVELQKGAAGEKSNDEKVYSAAFGWMSGVGGSK
jgi:cell pole-organizing protein PopZ